MDGFSDRGSTPLASTNHFHGKCEIIRIRRNYKLFVIAAYIFLAKKGSKTAKIAVFCYITVTNPRQGCEKVCN